MTETNFAGFPYLPHTQDERQEMLHAIGVRSFEELISHIPQDVRAKTLELSAGLSELELTKHVASLAAKKQACLDISIISRWRLIPQIRAVDCTGCNFQRRVFYRLHSLPTRSKPGQPAGHLRISDGNLSFNRNGSRQRFNV